MIRDHIIYILLTHSGSLLSKCINVCTKEPYTHVSIAFDPNLKEIYSFGRIKPFNPIFAGFVKEDTINGTYRRFPETKCALYSLAIDSEQYKKLKTELYKFKVNQTMYRYNLLGLFGVVLNIPIERNYNYFCSQFVATLLTNSEILLFNKHLALVSPKDFRNCNELTLIYEGVLKNYRYSFKPLLENVL